MWMMRCSVAVNSRPSILACRPVPPKKLSTTANTNFGSSTISAVPRNGLIFTRLRFVGTCRVWTYSLNFLISTGSDGDFRRAAQQVVEAHAEQAREALIDHLERGHAPAHDAHLVLEIVGAGFAAEAAGVGADRAAVDAVDQGVDLGLIEDLL